jgi:transcriptional regulator with XRE-family HTH domain
MTIMPENADIRAAARTTRRSELGAFLKSRRARISPEDVGLAPGPRRRTPGLRREEVAQLAGVGVTWYTWLEQGRPINVSVQVLDAVARTLRLDAAEHAHLYRLADVPTVPAVVEDSPLPPELQIILDQLHPLPAVLLSARYDVLTHNDAYAALCPGFARGERNVIRRVFLTPACCNPYAEHPEHLARMVGYLRSAYGKNLHDPGWIEFVDTLCAQSPLFAALWARNDVASPLSRAKVIRNVITGDVNFVMTSMALSAIAGAWVQILTPADDHSWGKLRMLLGMSESERTAAWERHADENHRQTATA